LRDLDYSPKVNHKKLGQSSPERDQQFRYIKRRKRLFLRNGWPIISVDAKKRELVGWFKNPGVAWRRQPYSVHVYDFRSLAEGIGIPFGIYDPVRNEGFVYVGTSANTAELAVDAIVWWWQTYGRHYYPNAPSLLILADGGSSNGCRVRLWKHTLARRLVDAAGLEVTVSHYPTGASKWNPVEHGLFGPISKNWEGYPLFSYQRMTSLIRGTSNRSGLRVRAKVSRRKYHIKKKVSDDQMRKVNLHPHKLFPKWNYTITP